MSTTCDSPTDAISDRRLSRRLSSQLMDVPAVGHTVSFLANVNYYMLSPVRLSATLVHPTQAIEIFSIFLCCLVPRPSVDIHGKFYGDRPRGTPPSGQLNARGVAKYSDF